MLRIGCGRYDAEPTEFGAMLCNNCRERAKAAERTPARIVGRQPAVCGACGEPFDAVRVSQRFCSPACKQRAWRAARRAESVAV